MSDDYLSKAKQDIDQWEHEGPSWLAQVGDFILWPAAKAADLLSPNGVQDAVGKGLDAAQTLAGHADPKTTLRAYARVQKGRVLSELAGVLDLGRRAA